MISTTGYSSKHSVMQMLGERTPVMPKQTTLAIGETCQLIFPSKLIVQGDTSVLLTDEVYNKMSIVDDNGNNMRFTHSIQLNNETGKTKIILTYNIDVDQETDKAYLEFTICDDCHCCILENID